MPWPGRKQQSKAGPVSQPSQAPVAAADSTEPKSLWEVAFGRLTDEKPDLVRRFNGVLESETHPVASSANVGQQGLPTQAQLSELIEGKLARMKDRQWRVSLGKTSIEVRKQIDRILQIVIVAKDLGSSLASMDPIHAGIPWAGVCVLLPLLLNDSQQRTIVVNGVESIAKLIRRFLEVENFYLGKTHHRLCQDLEEALVTLYYHILEFEARAVCQFDRNAASQAGRNIVKADGWQNILNEIEKSETTCNILTRIIDTDTQHKWNDEIEALLSEQANKVDKILELSEQSNSGPRQQVKRSATLMDDQVTLNQDRDEKKCLALFRTTDYEFDKDKNPPRLAGTCEWFLKHPIYQDWYQNKGVGWLWVTANPGCGKSVLARSLVDDFSGKETDSRTCYFFFKDDSEKNRTIQHALCAILHQLIVSDRNLLEHAMDAFYANGEQLPSLVEPLWKVLLAVLERLPASVVCIFDALDECSEASRIVLIQRLAALFSAEPNKPNIKVLMTSRPNTPIGNAIWEHGINPVSIQLTGEREDESQAISEEIDLYIADKVRHFEALRQYRGIWDDAHQTLHDKLKIIENRTYLWVSLIFPELESHAGLSKTKLLGLIKQVPATVQEAYEKILSRSLDSRRARILLHIVVAAYRPLTLPEMNTALAVQDHSDPMEVLDTDPTVSFEITVRELCGLFIMVKENQIYLIHQTAKDFLVRTDEMGGTALADLSSWNWRYSFEPTESHRILARTCIIRLYLSYARQERTAERMSANQLQHHQKGIGYLSDYAGTFWMKHFSKAGFFDIASIEAPMAQIYTTASTQTTMTWANLYQLAPKWSPTPGPSYEIQVEFNPLNLASFYGHELMVQSCLKDFSAIEKGITSIRWALQKGHTEVAHALLDTIPGNASNGYILNAVFHIACSVGEEGIVARLLSDSAVDPRHVDSLGRTPLLWATKGGHNEIVQQLIKAYEQRGLPKENVEAAFLMAAFEGFGSVIDSLISYGPAEARDYRVAALSQAVFRDQAHVLQNLLEDHGRLAIPKGELENLIIVALTNGKKASIDVLLRYPSINVNVRDSNGQTPLMLAEDIDVKEKLIRMGADVNIIACTGWNRCYEGEGETPLYRAVANSNHEYVQLLLRHGAAVDVRSWNGETALCKAVTAPDCTLVRLLLESGADPTIRNRYGFSPAQGMEDLSAFALKNHKLTPEELKEVSRLMENPIHRRGEQTKDSDHAVRPCKIVLDPQSYREILQDELGSTIDLETFEQILEMDDVDDVDFSRSLVMTLFSQSRPMIAQAKAALLLGDFRSLRAELGETVGNNCQMVGFSKLTQICEPFTDDKTFKLYLWVGCRFDGEDETVDVACLARLWRALADLEPELERMERRMQDFYYEIQGPRFDPDESTLEQQRVQLLREEKEKSEEAPTAQPETNEVIRGRRSSI